ncbi:MAG: tetratricopeptide repeat protein [Thermodesulfovibrionaceae bacterium]
MLILFILSFASASADELFQRGIEQYKQENYEEALEIFEEIYKRRPSTLVSFYLGLTYKQLLNYNKAKEYFYKSLTDTPKINDAYIEIAEVLYFLGEIEEAMQWLNEAEKEFIMPSKVYFLKGLVFLKLGKLESARKAFERAKSIDPALTQAADLQIAIIYSAERKIKEAMKTLEGLIKVEPKSDIAEFASDYLTALKTAFKEWSITISLAYLYDDNVVSKPTTIIGVSAVDEISGKRDSAQVTNLKVSYRPLLSGEFLLTGDLNIYTKTYFSSYKFDTTVGTITFIPGFNIKKGFITLPVSYSHMWLNEREYMSLFSLTPTLSLQIIQDNIMQLSVGYSKREMLKYMKDADPDEDRDSNQYSVSVGYFCPFRENGIFYLRYEYTIDDTQGKNWNSYAHRVSVGLIYPVIKKLSLHIAGEYTHQKYKNINTYTGGSVRGFPDTPTKRKDKLYSLTTGVIFEFSKNIKTTLNYYHLRADSNFPIYDYRRNIYTVELSLTF